MPRRLLDFDPLTGVATYHTFDPVEKTTTIEEWQDVGPYLERAREYAKNEDLKRRGIKGSWMLAASIPVGVQYKLLREKGLNLHNKNHIDEIMKLIDRDPEYQYLKAISGRIT